MEPENNTERQEAETSFKTPSKVTVGFKCSPETKLTLSKEATELDMTLSEYVESLILHRREVNKPVNPEPDQHLKTIDKLKRRLAFYENDLLTNLYNAHKNQTVIYNNTQDETVEITINDITDVYTVLVNSFKNQ